jgi:phosphoglycolate phosphatase
VSPNGAPALVVFDFDGTLADTWRDIATALNRTLEESGLERVEGPEVRRWIGEGVVPLLRRAVPGLESDPAGLERIYARFSEHYERGCLDTTAPYPEMPACLEALDGSLLVVASNKPTRFLSRVIEGLGLARHFALVLGGDSLDVRKPDPAVFEHVRARLGRGAGEAWMVGDSAIDVETGRAAGARTIGCAWGLRGRDELDAAGVDFLVERPGEIPPVILGDR